MTQKMHGSNMTFRLGLLTVAFCLLIVSTSQAATLYWNAPNGGPGTWDTATQLWSTLALGPLNTTWSLGSTDDAVFQNTPGSGLISIATGGVSVHNMTFGVSGYTIQDLPSQTDALSLSGSGNTITVTNATDTATISSVLSGAGFTKLGLGTLVLSGNNTNLTGTVTIGTLNAIDGGVLKVTNSNALGTAAVTITGGFSGSVAGPSTVNPAQLQLSGGITLTNVISIQQKRDGTGSGPGGHLNPPPNGFPASILNVDGNNFIGVDNTTASIHMQANGNETIIESDGGKLTIRGNVVNDGVSGSNPPAERNLILTGTATGEISGKITAGTSTQGIAVFKEGTGTWILSGINDGSAVQYAGSAFWVHNGVLRLTNSSALGASGSAGGVTVASSLYDEPTGVTTPATGRIELAGSITIPKAIALQGRPDATNAQLANYSDSNTISGNILLTQVDANSTNGNGSTYLIQSNSGLLTLGSIQNNSTVAGTRQVNLQGNGTVSGAIGGGSASSPNDISITKGGTGTWTLSGVNTYTGNTTVNGGTLALSSSASVSSSPALTVNSAGILDLSGFSSGYTLPGSQKLMGTGTVKGDVINGASSAIVPGTDGTVGTLTLQNNLTLGNVSGGNIKFDLGTDTLPADNDLLAVTGNLAINGSAGYTNLVINMTGGQLGTGTYKLISYGGSFSGSVNNINLGAMSSSGTTRQSFTLNNNATLKEIDLNVVGSPASLVWKGNLSNTWDRNPAGTLNWLNGGSADKFYDLDSVTFNATGAAQPIVNIAGNWTPGPVLVSAATDYTFTGTGSLIGAMTLTKSGTGKLTIANTGTNTYSGTTTINVGTLQIGNGGANGSIGAGSVVDNATLVFNQSSNYATAATTAISGAGSLQKQGTGVLTLNGNSASFTGGVTISAGAVVMGSANALGSTSDTAALAISNNAALDVNGNSVGARNVSVQGAGPDGTSGAIVSSASTDQINAFQYVTLTGNTTFGGSGRWDIRSSGGGSLTGAGYTLTKVGTNLISLANLGETGLGTIDVKNGALQIEGTTTLGNTANTITVESNGMLSMYNLGTNILNKNLSLQGGTLGTSYGNAGTTNNFGGAVTLVGGGNLSPAVDTSGTSGFTVSGSIGGTGMLTKTGTAGTVILTGTANSWNGGTTINGGTLQIGNGGANGSLPDVVGTTITNNGTLLFNSTNNTNLLNTTITSTATPGTGVGYLTVNGTGIVTLGQANSYTGTTQVGVSDGAIGYLKITASGALGSGTLYIAGGSNTGNVSLDGASAPGGGITITNPISVDGRRDTQNLALAPHILNVSGNNTISGDISCYTYGNQYLFQSDAGKLTLGNIINKTGTAGSNRNVYLQGAGDGEVTGSITSDSGVTAVVGVIKSGSGTWTLSGGNSYTGNTVIRQGTLAIGSSSYLSSAVIQVMAGANFDVHNNSSYMLFGNESLSGSGTVIGDVLDSAGTIFSPGDSTGAGTLTFSNSSNTLTLAGSDYINYNISGATADLLDVKGNMTLSGNTTITVLPNSVISGRVYTVANVAGTLTNGTGVTVDSSSTRYTFTPGVSADGKKIILTASGSNMSLAWNGSAGTWDLHSTAAWNTSDLFYDADDVTFGTTSGIAAVSILSPVMPASVTVNSTNDYTFSTTTPTGGSPLGKITGDVGLVKQGAGALNINLANDYTGVTTISGGTIRIGVGGTLGDTTGGTVINGGTLDTNAQSLGAEPVTVQGTGVGGNGAIVNNSGTALNNTLRFVTLSNDTTIGGNARWDIRTDNATATPASLTGNGYNLTKVGANTIYLVNLGNTGLGNINVNAGTLGVQGSTILGNSSSTLTVASTATLSFYAVGTGNVISKNLDLKDGSTLYNGGGNAAAMTGNTTLEGNAAFSTDNNFTLTGIMTGTGAGAGLTKSGTAILTLAGSQNYSGATTINAGTLQLSGTGTIGNVANGATFEVLAGSHTAGNVSGAGTTLLDAGTALTATSVAQNTLTIGAGATLTIAAIPGGPLAGMGSISPVPEPATWAMLLLAAMGLGIYRRRSR